MPSFWRHTEQVSRRREAGKSHSLLLHIWPLHQRGSSSKCSGKDSLCLFPGLPSASWFLGGWESQGLSFSKYFRNMKCHGESGYNAQEQVLVPKYESLLFQIEISFSVAFPEQEVDRVHRGVSLPSQPPPWLLMLQTGAEYTDKCIQSLNPGRMNGNMPPTGQHKQTRNPAASGLFRSPSTVAMWL